MPSERFDWNAAAVDWDGGGVFTLHVPHAVEGWAGRWLERELRNRLRLLLGDVLVAVRDAGPAEEWGQLTIAPVTLPLPRGAASAQGIREVIEEAAALADVAAREATEQAANLLDSLSRV
ncbi:MAG: hypothetical protein M3N47_09225 [Chloroflexota bacterium]|nr:hypothetical protein [Chloroflexota bacterium]